MRSVKILFLIVKQSFKVFAYLIGVKMFSRIAWGPIIGRQLNGFDLMDFSYYIFINILWQLFRELPTPKFISVFYISELLFFIKNIIKHYFLCYLLHSNQNQFENVFKQMEIENLLLFRFNLFFQNKDLFVVKFWTEFKSFNTYPKKEDFNFR